jgi:hypothetical protein
MSIRQARIFVNHSETLDWAETLIGRVVRALVAEFTDQVRWFWFSRYICLIGAQGEDRGDCDFDAIPNDFKQPFNGGNQPGHRSLRFRYEIEDGQQTAFETRLQQLVNQNSYVISDFLDYDQVGDTGGHRFLGVENRQAGRDLQRARLVTHLYQVISQLVIDALVGPDQANRYRIERNDLVEQNPNNSTFESLHHMFCNITQVPVSILLNAEGQAQLLGTFWGLPRGHRQNTFNGKQVTEVYIPY